MKRRKPWVAIFEGPGEYRVVVVFYTSGRVGIGKGAANPIKIAQKRMEGWTDFKFIQVKPFDEVLLT